MLSIAKLDSHVKELCMHNAPLHQFLSNAAAVICHNFLKRVLAEPHFVCLVPHVEDHCLEKC